MLPLPPFPDGELERQEEVKCLADPELVSGRAGTPTQPWSAGMAPPPKSLLVLSFYNSSSDPILREESRFSEDSEAVTDGGLEPVSPNPKPRAFLTVPESEVGLKQWRTGSGSSWEGSGDRDFRNRSWAEGGCPWFSTCGFIFYLSAW